MQGRPSGQADRHDKKSGSTAEVTTPLVGATVEPTERSRVASRASMLGSEFLPKRRFAGHKRHEQPTVDQAAFLPFSWAPGSGTWETKWGPTGARFRAQMGLKTGPMRAPFWARFGALMPQSGTPAIGGLASNLGALVSRNAILHSLTTRPETSLKGRFQGTGGLAHPGGANGRPRGETPRPDWSRQTESGPGK